MNRADAEKLLRFEPPDDKAPRTWAQAEKAALKFPDELVKMAKELNEARREAASAWEEREKLYGFVVRNLIKLVENCKEHLPRDSPDQDAAEEKKPGPAGMEEAEALAVQRLAGAARTAEQILEELGVVAVDLLGRCYSDVVVDGEKIEDPFTIFEAEKKGPGAQLKVREVLSDLWISRRHGRPEVLRRGVVRC